MNLFLLLLSSIICKLRAQQASFSLGAEIYVSLSLRSLVILVHCSFRPVNLSPLSKSLLSMHTQPSRLKSVSAEPGSHFCNVTFYFVLFFFLSAGHVKESLCSRVNVLLFFISSLSFDSSFS